MSQHREFITEIVNDREDRRNGDDRLSADERRLPEEATPEWSDPERRHHRRHRVANLRVKGPVSGDVLNASHLGMAIQANESLKVGWSYAFRMRKGGDVIRIPGKVQWCRLVQLLRIDRDDFLPVYRMGVRLAGDLWSKPQLYFYP